MPDGVLNWEPPSNLFLSSLAKEPYQVAGLGAGGFARLSKPERRCGAGCASFATPFLPIAV
jgi:hypothetical protein